MPRKVAINRDQVIGFLRDLTTKQFAELFYEVTSGKSPWPGEEDLHEVRYVLAYVSRSKLEPDPQWEFYMVCPVPYAQWVDDAPICQVGECCGFNTISWAKSSDCPICGGAVYGT